MDLMTAQCRNVECGTKHYDLLENANFSAKCFMLTNNQIILFLFTQTLFIFCIFHVLTTIHKKDEQSMDQTQDKIIVCTISIEETNFKIEKVDLNLCTHIICIDNIWDKTIGKNEFCWAYDTFSWYSAVPAVPIFTPENLELFFPRSRI